MMMMRKKESVYDPEKNWVIRNFRRFFPVSDRYEGNRFFTRAEGQLKATPLFLVLLAIESSDIIFAVDSIPAIFAITPDPFIVYTSNIFAMLGLRALYFAVAGFMQMFHFLHYGFASIILILGVKMLLSDVYKIPVEVSLVLVMNILLICVIVSLLRPRRSDLKPLLERTERLGLIPFRRLLLIENIIDLGDLRVRNAMCPLAQVQVIRLERPWEENLHLMRTTRFSRYPVVERAGDKPSGVIHVKHLFAADPTGAIDNDSIRRLARPGLEMSEDLPLEEALARFQRRFDQMAIVLDTRGEWTGIITIEDVLEELVGKIGDEFDLERTGQFISLADALHPGRIVLDLRGESMSDAIRQMIVSIPRPEWPVDPELILRAVLQREQAMSTYVGRGLAIPHARLDGLTRPVLAFGRSNEGIPLETTNERAELVFLLLTPSGMSRVQVRLLAEIAGLFESDYVTERLRKAETPGEVIEAIRAAQQVVVD
jgi:tellurite resistance protein TerC